MKTNITVVWSWTTEVEVDPSRLDDPVYCDQIRIKAITDCYAGIHLKDGIVADCEDFPDLAE
jgi:hypothetical protein